MDVERGTSHHEKIDDAQRETTPSRERSMIEDEDDLRDFLVLKFWLAELPAILQHMSITTTAADK